jgi:hypothetical protein
MPCFIVAEVARMKCASSMPRNCSVLRMVGNVPSPTPTLLMSGDSSTVISRWLRSGRRSALAR